MRNPRKLAKSEAGNKGLAREEARGALADVRLRTVPDSGDDLPSDGERRSADERRRATAYGRARGRLS